MPVCNQASHSQLCTIVPLLVYEVWTTTENRRTEAVEMSFLRAKASVTLPDVEVKKGVVLERQCRLLIVFSQNIRIQK